MNRQIYKQWLIHLSLIDLTVSIVTVAGFLTWRSVKNTIKDTIVTKIDELARTERESIKVLIKNEVYKIAKKKKEITCIKLNK